MKQPYPSYRPSGVQWLGDLPEHWEVRQLGRVGSFFKGGGGTRQMKSRAVCPVSGMAISTHSISS